ncbi:hypothetical protein, partial [Deinococcus pimensis]|uniref:hypothetical protein n=1 Tax=Deinococcus pimensis TaxID=309888 RepID=UPI0005EB7B5F
MHVHPTRTAVLAALLVVTLAPAQPPVSLYGGVFRPGQEVRVGVSAPARTELTLSRVEDPLGVFAATRDPHQPDLPPGTRLTRLRTLSTPKRDYGDVSLGRLPRGLYVLRAGGVGTLLLVSDLGLVVKRDASGALTYAADRESGRTRAARVWKLGTG